jgi:hypothetical protein
MSQNTHELPLGDTWEENPSAWKNFVLWLIEQKGLEKQGHMLVMEEIERELESWNLTLTQKSLQGSSEDLTRWILSYA